MTIPLPSSPVLMSFHFTPSLETDTPVAVPMNIFVSETSTVPMVLLVRLDFHVVPLSVEIPIPLSVAAYTFAPLTARALMTLPTRPFLASVQLTPASVDLYTPC